MIEKIWTCKVGGSSDGELPNGCDGPMREAVEEAYKQITGKYPEYLFTGWGGKLSPLERTIAEDRGDEIDAAEMDTEIGHSK